MQQHATWAFASEKHVSENFLIFFYKSQECLGVFCFFFHNEITFLYLKLRTNCEVRVIFKTGSSYPKHMHYSKAVCTRGQCSPPSRTLRVLEPVHEELEGEERLQLVLGLVVEVLLQQVVTPRHLLRLQLLLPLVSCNHDNHISTFTTESMAVNHISTVTTDSIAVNHIQYCYHRRQFQQLIQ